jgi:hypothetical protein
MQSPDRKSLQPDHKAPAASSAKAQPPPRAHRSRTSTRGSKMACRTFVQSADTFSAQLSSERAARKRTARRIQTKRRRVVGNQTRSDDHPEPSAVVNQICGKSGYRACRPEPSSKPYRFDTRYEARLSSPEWRKEPVVSDGRPRQSSCGAEGPANRASTSCEMK